MSTGWGGPDTEPTRLVLLRHGQTPLSVERRFAGRGDIPLTDEGHAQAEAAARRLAGWGIEAVVSSPLLRTRQTAGYAADLLGLAVEEDEGFVETDFGAWEGLTFAEARESDPEQVSRWLSDPETGPPGGESFAEVSRRVGKARDALLERHRGRRVLVVSHVTPIKVAVQQAMLAPIGALYRMHLDTACLTEVDCYADGPQVVRSLNDTAHLET
ncbi:histidine phosphatase family protein [Nocardiopsis valliformis]|uniref:histidine phosphatase family protein n=1 Tax=Nocardiopsis valliformis TaxID=239974 RepID=UPI000344ED5C|nr:histidine phosphatase family protein [Nocardiopsis valliformis]